MTKLVNVHEAKTHLSRLLDEALAGEDIVIARSGHPIARLVLTEPAARPAGVMAGIWPDLDLDDPFFDPLPVDELGAWEQ
jgi:prevent-host-death family protein